MRTFRNDDQGFLEWIDENPDGFVANVDNPQSVHQYPMVHLTSDSQLRNRSNYTTGRYFKVCSTDLSELDDWSKVTYGKELTWCRRCQNIFDRGERPARFTLPEEVGVESEISEGAVTTISVNAYERSAVARNKCIEVHGAICTICAFDFEKAYGAIARGFIHVHHLKPLASAGGVATKVDPTKDLIPVCPNCHAIIHLGGGCRSIDEMRELRRDGHT